MREEISEALKIALKARDARRTTTLRGADRGGDAPHLHRLCAPAQVVWSFEIRTALSRARPGA